MSGMDYWQRLSALSLYSQERRRERYQIIFLWKVAQGLIEGYSANFIQNDKRGRLMVMAPLCTKVPAAVRKAREASLQVRGAGLFNCLPRDIRDLLTGTPEIFKIRLADCLSRIPDRQLLTSVPGRITVSTLMRKQDRFLTRND